VYAAGIKVDFTPSVTATVGWTPTTGGLCGTYEIGPTAEFRALYPFRRREGKTRSSQILGNSPHSSTIPKALVSPDSLSNTHEKDYPFHDRLRERPGCLWQQGGTARAPDEQLLPRAGPSGSFIGCDDI
jgi:hypothetical protein